MCHVERGPKGAKVAHTLLQLVVNVVAVATAAGGALFLRESPLTAVQMVRAHPLPCTCSCVRWGAAARACAPPHAQHTLPLFAPVAQLT